MSRFLLLLFECCNGLKFKIIATLFAIFVFDSTNAATWYVNDASTTGDVFTTAAGSATGLGTKASPFLTLAKALTSAAAGDTIIVDSGTYNDKSLSFNKANVTVIGAGVTKTIFNNNFASSDSNQFGTISAANVTLKNFEVTKYNSSITNGKAITITGTGATGVVLDGVLVDNNGSSGGNGAIMVMNGAKATIKNGADSCNLPTGLFGGGVDVDGTGTELVITNQYISKNARAGGNGGAINITNGGKVTVSNSVFDGNSAINGGAIFVDGGTLIVNNSIFKNNVANQTSSTVDGGAIAIGRNSIATISNTQFISNTAGTGSATGRGGAISLNTNLGLNTLTSITSQLTLTNVSFTDNTATSKGRHIFGDESSSRQGTITMTNASFSGTGAGGTDINQNTLGEVVFSISNSGNPTRTNVDPAHVLNTTASTGFTTPTVPGASGSCVTFNCANESYPPVIASCASNKTIAQVNCKATLPDYTAEISASDDCTFTVTQSPVAGTSLSIGTTTVTIKVTDASGNTATCTFTVTVTAETASTKFGDYASAVYVTKNGTSSFNNTTGSGANLIGSTTFTGQNLGTYSTSSGNLKLSGGEIKTWKNGGNVCSATLHYLIYKTGSRPTSPTFSTITLPFKEICSGGSFPTGGPCSTNDQKWSTIAQSIDLTNYTAGDYSLETYYSYTGGETSSSCTSTQYINNSCNNYIATFTLINACNITTTATVTNALCKNGNGTATLSSSNGTSPYTYTTTGGTISGSTLTATAGTYTVTTTDANSCTTTTSVTITEPTALTATATAGTILCNGGTADVTLAISGGTAPYTTTPSTTGLSAGTYTFEVKDANDCTTSVNVTIAQPDALTATATAGTILCNGGTTDVTLAISGGTAPYTTTPATTGLSAGTYTFEVKDANDCTTSITVTITEPAKPAQPTLACYEIATFNTVTCSWDVTGTQPTQPSKTNCWDSYTFNTTSCAWENVGTQPTEPSKTNCWDSYTFNTTSCAWENVGTQPTEPSKTNCWDSYTFNTTSCAWENVGTQPTEPSKTNCWDSFTFNTTSCAWENVGTQPTEPSKTNCWDSFTFNTTSCAWENVGTQPTEPSKTNCWDSYTFNTTSCAWENVGTQPTEPSKTNCWDSFTFNTTSCAWENVGTQPTEPSKTNCWDSYTFNTTSCAWENVGAQPTEPSKTNCWDSYTFNTTSCAWENVGTQPTEPSKTNCWDSYTFNTTSCAWENVGTQPTEPSKTNCWDSYTFNTTSCAWENVGTQPTEPSKTNCWDSFTFNTTSCAWENVGTQPTEPSKTNCWDSYTFNTTSCAWENVGAQPTEPSKTNCWDSYTFNTTSCAWENVGTQPTEPSKTNCWDSYTFNTTSCAWENVGTQPTEPSKTNCWDSYTFNTTSCAWENVGTQPTEPSKTNCWDSYTFNTTSCAWENVGTQPTEPSKTNCWDSYTFNTTSCAWENVGTQPTEPSKTNCWDSYTFNTTSCAWENVGTQPTEPSKTNCWDSYTFNTTSCAWENVGTQPTEPSKTNCWDSYTFNTTSCAWENVGTQPTEPSKTNCWDSYTFNTTSCAWENVGTQPTEPSKTNCWDSYTFNTTSCAWENVGTQPTEPSKTNCWDSYTFNTTSCAWENVGTQPTEPSKTNCWDSFTFNTTSCAWENVGTQPTEPSKTNCWDSYTFNTTSCAWENVGTQPTEPSKTNCWDSYTFNTTSCAWENVGTQPTEPSKTNCWDSYTFNTTSCAWENVGTQPTEPSKTNCWDSYTFNTTSCAWENVGTQPTEPSKTNCWDIFTFNTTSCAWENVGTQPTEPSKTNCWDSYTFNTTSCAWENVGTQPTEPSKTNCWDSFTFNTTSCAWENVGTQPTEPSKTNCWDSFTFNTTSCAWENVGTQPTEPSKTNCWDSYTFNTTSCAWENVGTQPTEPSKTNCWDSFTFNTTSCAWENTGIELTATISSSNNLNCNLLTSTLTATASESNVTYLWNNGITTATNTVVSAGTYTVVITNNKGCSVTESIIVTQDTSKPIAPSVTITQPTCLVSTGTVSIENPDSNLLYSFDGVTYSSVTTATLSAGSYAVTAKGTNGCISTATNAVINTQPTTPNAPSISASANSFCTGGSVILTATGCTGQIVWSNGQTGPTLTVSAGGTFTAQCSANGCLSTSSNSVTIIENALPTIQINGGASTVTACNGDTVRLTASGGTMYSWSNGLITDFIDVVATNGSYTVIGTNANGCQSEATITIVTNALPTPTISGTTNFCSNATTTLTASGGTSYLWSTGATTASITVSTAGTYSVVATNANGCKATVSQAVTTYTCGPTCPTTGNLLTNGSFENPKISTGATWSPTTQNSWTNLVDGGRIETWSNGFEGVPPVNGTQIIELNTYQLGTIVQNVTVQANEPLTLSYFHRSRANTGQRVRVEIRNSAGAILSSTVSTSNLTWQKFQVTFQPNTSDIQVRFISLDVCTGDAGCGNLMDNVVLNYASCLCTSVPNAPTITSNVTNVDSTTFATLTAVGCTNGTIRWSNGQTGNSITTNVPGEYFAQCIVSSCESIPSNKIVINATSDAAVTCPTFQWRSNGVFHVNFCVKNNGSAPISGTAYVKDVDGTVFSDNYSNLLPGATKCFTYRKRFITCGSTYTATVGTTIIGTDINTANNECSGSEVMNCIPNPPPYDPNFKDVSPKRNLEGGIYQSDEWLTYTIQCQNDGKGRAVNVAITDDIDITKLDISTLQLVSSTHPVKVVVLVPNKVAFQFHNIQLANSALDLAGSQARIVFKIKRLPGQAVGTIIENKAGIYFDNEPVVMTNVASSKIIEPCNASQTLSGNVTPSRKVFAGQTVAQPFTLANYSGIITGWQVSTSATFDASNTTTYNNYTSSFTYSSAVNATTYVRALVQTGGCNIAPSTAATINLLSCPTNGNLVQDGSFESPLGNGYSFGPMTHWKNFNDNNNIERWSNNFIVPAAEGKQLIELNGNMLGRVYQDVVIEPGQAYIFSFKHRARSGVEIVKATLVNPDNNTNSVSFTNTAALGVWKTVTNVYNASATQTKVRILFETVTSPFTGSGNLLDDVKLNYTKCACNDAVLYAGTVSSDTKVFAGQTVSKPFILTNNLGTVTAWQVSTSPTFDSSNTVTIATSTSSFVYPNTVSTKSYVRAMVKIGDCSLVGSSVAIIDMLTCPTSGNLLTNGSFENSTLPVNATSGNAQVTGWSNLAESSIEVWKKGTWNVTPVNGDYMIELDGLQFGKVYQDVTVAPNIDMTLTYNHMSKIASGDKLRVDIIDLSTNAIIQTYTSTATLWTWNKFALTFKPTSSNIRVLFTGIFSAAGHPSHGNIMDQVVLNYNNCMPINNARTIKSDSNNDVVEDVVTETQTFTLYPNPTENVLFIKTEGLSFTGELKYQIFTVNGVLVRNASYDNNSINVSDLQAGYYIIKFEDQGGFTKSTNFIKK